ncbi:MAG: hypothetical protein ABEH81_10095 [Halopenitus sp.]
MDWQARDDELLYDGESIRERVDAGSDLVVVTSHRVLAFTPEGDGANFRAVDRPNVTGVRAGAQGDADWLRRAAVAGVGGLGALALGLVLDFDSLVPTGGVDVAGGGAAGIGGLLETIGTLLRVVALLDDLFVAVGLLAVLAAVAVGSLYWTQREPKLTIAVAGDDDIQLAWSGDDEFDEDRVDDDDGPEAAADRLRRALFS